MRILLIPGLGYDCRIFDHLELSDVSVEHLNWIAPKPKELLHDYALRLFATCKPSSEKTIIIGHSLGGVVAQEIASVHPIEKVILISSIKSRKELPLSFKLIQPLRFDVLFTKEISIQTIQFWGTSHGFETPAEKELFKSMVGQHSNSYLQWALRALSSWEEPKNLMSTKIVQIHGTKDKTLPYSLIENPDYTINEGTHICVLKKAAEVSRLINQQLL